MRGKPRRPRLQTGDDFRRELGIAQAAGAVPKEQDEDGGSDDTTGSVKVTRFVGEAEQIKVNVGGKFSPESANDDLEPTAD